MSKKPLHSDTTDSLFARIFLSGVTALFSVFAITPVWWIVMSFFPCVEISCSQRKMRQELINETKSHCDSSSYVVHFMGLNGVRKLWTLWWQWAVQSCLHPSDSKRTADGPHGDSFLIKAIITCGKKRFVKLTFPEICWHFETFLTICQKTTKHQWHVGPYKQVTWLVGILSWTQQESCFHTYKGIFLMQFSLSATFLQQVVDVIYVDKEISLSLRLVHLFDSFCFPFYFCSTCLEYICR